MSEVVHILFFMGGKYYVRHTEEHLYRDRKFTNTYRGVHMSVEVSSYCGIHILFYAFSRKTVIGSSPCQLQMLNACNIEVHYKNKNDFKNMGFCILKSTPKPLGI